MTRALFLDRDGVINFDHGYVHRAEYFTFLPGIFALCAAARDRAMPIHVVTNQSGIGRGLYSEAAFATLSAWMMDQFAQQDIAIAAVHHCPYHPVHGIGPYRMESPRRKPAPGMLLDAAAAGGLDLPNSVMVGDKASDMQAAAAAGLRTRILVSTDPAEIAAVDSLVRIAADLADARRSLIEAIDR